MSFGAPVWFWALTILPALGLLYVRGEQRNAVLLRQFISPRLWTQLAGNIDRFRRAVRFGFVLLALALAIVALARPRWGYTYEEVKRRGLDLLLAVDTSRSMLSNDVAPNRLERVKLAAQDLIVELNGDRAGLIAFAGRAFLQAPLTIDYDAAIESINDLDTKSIPEGGTNISEAIALAVKTFGKSATGNRALIIFTDGEELSGDAVTEAKKAGEANVKIFTVGVGTPQGSLIPVENGFVKDTQGQVVKSKLDENRLKEIAAATGGIYLHLENGPQTMRQLYRDGLAKLHAAEIDARLSHRPIERYQWPLGAAIIAMIVSLFINDRKRTQPSSRLVRREAAVALSLLLLASIQAFAVSGLDLYNQGQYDQAYSRFQDDLKRNLNPADAGKMQFDEGAAAYKLKKYDNALEAFSQALVDRSPTLQEKSHYNLGMTLEDRGDMQKVPEDELRDLENAKQHYEETLKLNPGNKAAAERLEIVKKKIEQLKKKKEQPPPTPTPSPPPPQKKNQNNDQDQNQQSGGGDSQQQAKNNQQQKDNQQSQQNQQNQQQNQQQLKPDSWKQNQQQNSQSNQNQKRGKNQQESASPSPSPGQNREEKNQPGAGESPSPSPFAQGTSPSPSPGENGATPSPSPGENGEGQSPSPTATPNGSPDKPRSGEIKGASEPGDEQSKQPAAAAEAEAEKPGEMSPQQAERLLKEMKGEEARVQLDERKPVHQVYKDW
jgi:Ca-activated chloride channel homolog